MTVHVAIAADDAIFRYSGNLLRSILAHASQPVKFHVFVDFEYERAEKVLNAAIPDADIEFYYLDASVFKDLPNRTHLSPMTYARLIMPERIEADRFLYFDTDMIAQADIAELVDIDLQDNLMAAVFNGGGLNSGLLLFDRESWIAEGLTEKSLKYAQEHRPDFGDQAAIEAAVGDRFLILEEDWNLVLDPVWTGKERLAEKRTSRAKVIHYCTGFKPWNLGRLAMPRHLQALWDSHGKPLKLPMNFRYEFKMAGWAIYMYARNFITGR
ncbi:General stress protein A [Roseovarius albus]|uniref:General stress protein A n=2 Tax=Roseovarius albus TaxID=1247867 RepID=A0A1X6YCD2_9RHOB|nr:General stress protein A [Roseovarius albus]